MIKKSVSSKRSSSKKSISSIKPKILSVKELRAFYEEELKRKDVIIENLKQENLLLLKTAFKRSSDNQKN